MLTQTEADYLIHLPKRIVNTGAFSFPTQNTAKALDIIAHDGRTKFIIDINRKGKAKPKKCSYLKRYRTDIILIRLDIDGPEHVNPSGEEIPCPHVHIFREGFDDKWAYSIPPETFLDLQDLVVTMYDFLSYCNVTNAHEIRGIQGELL